MASLIDLDGLAHFKEKLDDQGYLTSSSVDAALSSTSSNPVQNSAITNYITHLIWTGTQAEYDAAVAAGSIANGQIVQITDDDSTDSGWSLADTTDIDALF